MEWPAHLPLEGGGGVSETIYVNIYIYIYFKLFLNTCIYS